MINFGYGMMKPISSRSNELHTDWSLLEIGAMLIQIEYDSKKFVVASASRSNNKA